MRAPVILRLIAIALVAALPAACAGSGGAPSSIGSLAGGGGSGSGAVPVAPVAAASPATATIDSGDDWVTFAHDMQRTGYESQKLPITHTTVKNLQLKWSVYDKAGFKGGPIVVKGIVYAVAQNGDVLAVSAKTGKKLWTRSLGTNVTAAMTPAYYNGRLFVATHDPASKFVALNADTGATLWKQTLNGGVRAAPVDVNGVVYVGTSLGDPGSGCHPGAIYAFNDETGASVEVWATVPGKADGGAIWGPITYDGNNLFFGTGNTCNTSPDDADSITSITLAAQSRWHVSASVSPTLDDDVAGGMLPYGSNDGYIVGKNGYLYDVNRTTGAVNWKKTYGAADEAGGFATPAITGSTMIVAVGSKQISGADGMVDGLTLSGGKKWEKTTQDAVVSSAAVTSDLAFVELDNSIQALDPETGKVYWSIATKGDFEGSPAIVEDGLFAADLAGYIYAFNVPSGTTATAIAAERAQSDAAMRASGLSSASLDMPTRVRYLFPGYCLFDKPKKD